MKIGILTFHFAHNYGAVLQAYALQKAISLMNHTCEIIDYQVLAIKDLEPKYYNPFKAPTYNGYNKYIKIVIYNMLTSLHYTSRWKKFDQFIHKELKLGAKVSCKEDFAKLDYSAYICGSDQIWNPAITDGFDPVYFCGFPASHPVTKIAYAASCGKSFVEKQYEEVFLKLVDNFNYVSVRETEFAKNLSYKNKETVQFVADPTLLADKSIWRNLENQNRQKKAYLLLYIIEENLTVVEIARKIALDKKLEVIEITHKKQLNRADIKQMDNCSPSDFITLFKYADFVVTNSFHGTCFSLIYQKPFYTVPHSISGARMENLLTQIGLSDRCISGIEDIQENRAVNYKEANKNLQHYREQSLHFLTEALENKHER